MTNKKYLHLSLIFLFLFIVNIKPVGATPINVNLTGKTIGSYYVRKGPGTTYGKAYNGEVTPINKNVSITKYSLTDDKSDGCSSGIWFYISQLDSKNLNGYVCSVAIKLNSDHSVPISGSNMAKMTDVEFEQYLKNEGFPTSYWASLKSLHKKHPNWIFKSAVTFKDWNSVVTDESEFGMSTYYVTSSREKAGHEAYLETKYSKYYDWSKNMFYNYDGAFYLANKKAVAYFMDPRNFLTEEKIFMFEGLNYNKNAKLSDLVTDILGTSAYTQKIIDAGKEFDISATHLASRIKQEGTLGSSSTKGIGVSCSGLSYSKNGTNFNGPLYNFYNIGATSSPNNAALNGLCYAAQTDTSTFRPWNTIDKAIRGGAKFIGSSYINVGQYTVYFQKYNTSAAASKSLGHQYMTNIEAPSSEATIVFNKYKQENQLNNDFVFYIPYYIDMPSSNASVPKLGNPNNWLKNITIDNVSINNFKGDTTTYNLTVPHDKKKVTVKASVVAYRTSSVSINNKTKELNEQSNEIQLNDDTTKITIKVTAANGSAKTYTVNINKEKENTTGNDNNSTNNTTPTIPNTNKDNETTENIPENTITVQQLLNKVKLKQNNDYVNGIGLGTTTTTLANSIKKHESKATISFTNSSGKSKSGKLVTGDKMKIANGKETKIVTIVIYGDTNGDGAISIKDLLQIQKNILNYTKLVSCYKEAADVNKDGKINIKDLLIVQKNILGYSNVSQV